MLKLFLVLFTIISDSLWSHEIAVIGGEPDGSLEFVKRIVKTRSDLIKGEHEAFSTTITYSVLNDYGIENTTLVMILDKEGTTSRAIFRDAIDCASFTAPVVNTNIGPIEDIICMKFSEYKDVAFVVPSGSGGGPIGSSCLAGNVLIVAALDQNQQDLFSFSNWGPGVRIASPSAGIFVILPGGKSAILNSSTAGLSIISAQLALLAKNRPSLRGAALINYFLENNTVVLPALSGKIDNGLALKW